MKRFGKLGWIVILFCTSLWGAPYTDNGNGTVTDSATGLVWQKCHNGQNATSCSGSGSRLSWSNSTPVAITYCEGLTLAGRSDWRLPNINELRTIVDYTKSTSPTIDTTAFPGTPSHIYWSSSTYSRSTNNAWVVDFSYGNVSYYTKTSNYYVRCVTGP